MSGVRGLRFARPRLLAVAPPGRRCQGMKKPASSSDVEAGFFYILPAMTYFPELVPSIIGAADLTTVFEMGTGVSLLLWSPGKRKE